MLPLPAPIWLGFQESTAHAIGHFNPDWASDCGVVYVLDFTHPDARRWLRGTFSTLREYGFRYFKLDFLTVGVKRGARLCRAQRPRSTCSK